MGAGSGHLARLLNATGRLSPPLVATEPFPEGYAQSEDALFGPGFGDGLGGVEAMRDGEAIARHRPALVLCAFMTAGEDWTPAWRAAGVDEYVLIGDLGHGKGVYSLNGDHGGYERVLLEEGRPPLPHHFVCVETLTLPYLRRCRRSCWRQARRRSRAPHARVRATWSRWRSGERVEMWCRERSVPRNTLNVSYFPNR